MGASEQQLFRRVLLPAALPVIVTGLRIGCTIGFLAILGSEMIAGLRGLGSRIVTLAEGMNTAEMFAYIVFVIILAMILNVTLSNMQRRFAERRSDGVSEAVAATGARTAAMPATRAFVRRNPAAARLGIVVLAFVLVGARRAHGARPQFPEPAVGHHRRDATRARRSGRAASARGIVLRARGCVRAGGRRRRRDRVAHRAERLHPACHATAHPAALLDPAGDDPAAVRALFRHRRRLKDCVWREPRHLSHHPERGGRRAERRGRASRSLRVPWARRGCRRSAESCSRT